MGRRRAAGFTLIELLVAAGVFVVAAGVAIPMLARALEQYRIGLALRDVERELQSARVSAVTANRPVRVRMNCPAVGQFRRVEVLGDPWQPDGADAALGRCSETAYVFPAPDQDPLTRPNHDGPVRRLAQGVSFAQAQSIEFWPDGTARVSAGTGSGAWSRIPVDGVEIALSNGRVSRRVLVNGMGRVQVLR